MTQQAYTNSASGASKNSGVTYSSGLTNTIKSGAGKAAGYAKSGTSRLSGYAAGHKKTTAALAGTAGLAALYTAVALGKLDATAATEAIQSIAQSAETQVHNAPQWIGGGTGGVLDKAGTGAYHELENLNKALTEYIRAIAGQATEAADTVKTSVNGAYENVRTTATNTVDSTQVALGTKAPTDAEIIAELQKISVVQGTPGIIGTGNEYDTIARLSRNPEALHNAYNSLVSSGDITGGYLDQAQRIPGEVRTAVVSAYDSTQAQAGTALDKAFTEVKGVDERVTTQLKDALTGFNTQVSTGVHNFDDRWIHGGDSIGAINTATVGAGPVEGSTVDRVAHSAFNTLQQSPLASYPGSYAGMAATGVGLAGAAAVAKKKKII